MNLVEIDHHAARTEQRIEFFDNLLDVGGGGSSAVELIQPLSGCFGGDVCHRGLAGSGRAEKNHIADFLLLDHTREHAARSDDMALPNHFGQSSRPHPFGERGKRAFHEFS
ncbi:hypothetical protein SDC9_190173 [bioreactor metagenome]|uniref:Uncharacterized protein n=1 Tax=bioreactor metagenome TaxID=1076179 RepID=A0A645HVL6_9ZZZZ